MVESRVALSLVAGVMEDDQRSQQPSPCARRDDISGDLQLLRETSDYRGRTIGGCHDATRSDQHQPQACGVYRDVA